MAASALSARTVSELSRALKTTLPLESTVLTSLKPALAKHCFSSGIFAFIGLTPRSRAT